MLTNLPSPVSSFVGRHEERATLSEVLASHRLVSLSGAPGVGKSRLALEIARTVGETLSGAAAYADMAAIAIEKGNDSTEAAKAPPSPKVLATQLGHAVKLLVLDNADHVLDTCRELADHLRARRPGLHILLTSREPLGVADEVAWRVPPLATPAPGAAHTLEELAGHDSVALFTARASDLREEFCLDAGNAETISEICRRLEGNPLALELAGGRTGVLSVTEILEHLVADPEQVFQPGRITPVRHRSLNAAIAWSHDTAPEPERILLARLSVFVGGFTLEAAQDVCAGERLPRIKVAQRLERLVAKSLVEIMPTGSQSNDPPSSPPRPGRPPKATPDLASRFGLTGTTRRFAKERLVEAGEAEEVASLHAAWCAVFSSAKERGHGGGQDEAWMERLEDEHDNVGAAFEWAVAHRRAKLALRLARGQMLFWQMSGHFGQAMDWLEKVLVVSKDAPAPLRASALHDAGYVAMLLGEFRTARVHLEEAVELFAKWPYSKGQSSARTLLGFILSFSADRRGLQILEQTLAEARVAGDDGCVSETLVAYGRARLFRGATSAAERNFAEAVVVAADLGMSAANAGTDLGWAALAQGRYDQAEAELSKALSLARRSADAHGTAVGLMWSGDLARRRGHYDQARSLLEEARQVAVAMGTPYPLATSLLGLARLALAEGDTARAAELFEAQLGLARRAELAFLVAPGLVGLGQVEWVGGELGEAKALLSEALEVAYDHDDRWGMAEALHARGGLARAGGENAGAAAFHHRALELQRELGDAAGMVASLEALAGLAAVNGAAEAAAVVFGAAEALRAGPGYPRSALEEPTYETDLALLEDTMGPGLFQAAREKGEALSLDDAIACTSRLAGRHATRVTGWASLSPGECEVASLIEQGLTNRQVAQRLQLSTETVKSRVSGVFSKLGISSRQELAEAVRRHTQEPADA